MTEQEFINNVLEYKDSVIVKFETKDGEEYKIVAGKLFYIDGEDNVDIYTFSDFGIGNIFEKRLNVLALKVYNYLTKSEGEEIVFVYEG